MSWYNPFSSLGTLQEEKNSKSCTSSHIDYNNSAMTTLRVYALLFERRICRAEPPAIIDSRSSCVYASKGFDKLKGRLASPG